jgi:hypothetical protein
LEVAMIVSVFVRRLKPGRTFEEFPREWEADVGFGVPTRVFNGPGLDDPRSVISIGFVAATAEETRAWLAAGSVFEQVRHERIETVVESTELHAIYESAASTTSPLSHARSPWAVRRACYPHSPAHESPRMPFSRVGWAMPTPGRLLGPSRQVVAG